MPASRSRTEHWKDSLRKICERGGGIELSVRRDGCAELTDPGDAPTDLLWRVKVFEVRGDRIVVEQPGAFGRSFDIESGVKLIGAMTVGQNRWMFHSRTLGVLSVAGSGPGSRPQQRLIIAMPEKVERCTRRNFYRISTAELRLPEVRCWPLLNPASVMTAETANRVRIGELMRARVEGVGMDEEEVDNGSVLLPEVGPMFPAKLMNISAGGLGLHIESGYAARAARHPLVWLHIRLGPDVPWPIAVSAKVSHSHIDSAQNMVMGLAFDFSHSQEHRSFVVGLVSRYMEQLLAGGGGGRALRAG